MAGGLDVSTLYSARKGKMSYEEARILVGWLSGA